MSRRRSIREELEMKFSGLAPADEDDTEEMIEWLRERFKPEEIFTEQQLDKWAVSKGYETH